MTVPHSYVPSGRLTGLTLELTLHCVGSWTAFEIKSFWYLPVIFASAVFSSIQFVIIFLIRSFIFCTLCFVFLAGAAFSWTLVVLRYVCNGRYIRFYHKRNLWRAILLLETKRSRWCNRSWKSNWCSIFHHTRVMHQRLSTRAKQCLIL